MSSNDKDVKDAIISHISGIALKQVKSHQPVLINYYQTTLMNNTFNVDQFIDKIITNYHVKDFAMNIILDDLNINKTFIDNIQKFKSNGIKCFIHANQAFSKIDYLNKVFKIKPIKYPKDVIVDMAPNFTI